MSNFDFEIGTKIKGKYSEYIILDRYIKSGKYPSIAHKISII